MKRVRSVVASLALTLTLAACAGAAEVTSPPDYRFEAVQQPVRSGSNSVVVVRLVQVRSGKPVTDAEVFERHVTPVFERAVPRGWAERRTPLCSEGNGNYRLVSRFLLDGKTTLKLGARVPGESRTILGQIDFTRIS
jgi:hypothetical protein